MVSFFADRERRRGSNARSETAHICHRLSCAPRVPLAASRAHTIRASVSLKRSFSSATSEFTLIELEFHLADEPYGQNGGSARRSGAPRHARAPNFLKIASARDDRNPTANARSHFPLQH